MNNELLQSAKDQAAMEYGRTTYKSVQISVFDSNTEEETLNNLADLDLITDRAMEIYAEMVVKNEPCNHPFDKVVQNNGDCVCFKCGHKIK